MKVVRLDEVELIVRKTVRSQLDYRSLLTGEPGTLGNFKLVIGTTQGDYTTPRHRHNFDQVRFQIQGTFDYDGLGKMTPGMIGYFPEGTPYGPTASGDDSFTLLLQCGGASGNGYMSDEEYNRSMAELKKLGEFHGGIYATLGRDGAKRNKDGYEAVWEHSRGHPVRYPKLRYTQPILMHPENFAWVPARAGAAAYKLLGDFSERHLRLGLMRLEAGAKATPADNSLYFVVRGSGEIGGERWERHAAIHLGSGERAEIQAGTEAEIFQMGLPDFAELPLKAAQAAAAVSA